MRFPSGAVRSRGEGALFRYPAGTAPQTIVLSSGFRECGQVRCAAPAGDGVAPQRGIEALAGTFDELRRAAKDRSLVVQRGVVVFTYDGGPRFSEAERDHLWQRFGVPVFEQYLSPHNELLASECDAHAGLHIVGSISRRSGFAVDASRCACGDKRPRLVPLEEEADPYATATAASAYTLLS